MSSKARIIRGRESQRIVARFLNDAGFPFADSVWGSQPGRDIVGTPGIAIEVKARRDLDLTGWMKQATKNAKDDLPVLVVRPDGYGESRIGEWSAVLRVADLVALLRSAGYGDPLFEDEI